jgi:hypothetical protein
MLASPSDTGTARSRCSSRNAGGTRQQVLQAGRCGHGCTRSRMELRWIESAATIRGSGPSRFATRISRRPRSRRLPKKMLLAIHQALSQIGIRHREVLVLHFLEDLSIAEIAESRRVLRGHREIPHALCEAGNEGNSEWRG